jgi:4-amino-4-deoxy-L-arabinose transferase-like glycosyltransferase
MNTLAPAPSRPLLPVLMPALLICLACMALRTLYLTLICPFDLVEDEAFYWEWALRPDWSYATKGPGIAWLIWLFTTLLDGSVIHARAGSIRMIAATSGLITALSQTLLTILIARRAGAGDAITRCAGILAALITTLMPMMLGTSLIATIDGPYLACWSLAMLAGFALLSSAYRSAPSSLLTSATYAIALGLALAAGFVMKYTIALLVPGLLLAWFLSRHHVTPRAWWLLLTALLISLLGVLPVAIWNSQHNWQTIRHLLGHLGLQGGDVPLPASGQQPSYSPLWTLTLIGTQLAFAGPIILAMVLASLAALFHTGRLTAGLAIDRLMRFAACCALPIAIFYLIVSFIAEPEANWPIAAWISLVPAAALWLALGVAPGIDHAADTLAPLKRGITNAALITGLVLITAVLIAPLLPQALGLQRVLGRLSNAHTHAADIQARKLAMSTNGIEPLISASTTAAPAACASTSQAAPSSTPAAPKPVAAAFSRNTGATPISMHHRSSAVTRS